MNMRIPASVQTQLTQTNTNVTNKVSAKLNNVADHVSTAVTNVLGKFSSNNSKVRSAAHPAAPTDEMRAKNGSSQMPETAQIPLMKNISTFLKGKKSEAEISSGPPKNETPLEIFTRTRDKHISQLEQKIADLKPGDQAINIKRQINQLKDDCKNALRNLPGAKDFVQGQGPVVRMQAKISDLESKLNAKLNDAGSEKLEVSSSLGSSSSEDPMPPPPSYPPPPPPVAPNLEFATEERNSQIESALSGLEEEFAVEEDKPSKTEIKEHLEDLWSAYDEAVMAKDEAPEMSSVLDIFTQSEPLPRLSEGKVTLITPSMVDQSNSQSRTFKFEHEGKEISIKYKGELKDEKAHGNGIMEVPEGIYKGEFVEGRIEGKGVFSYNNGDIHEGIFKNGSMVEGKITEGQARSFLE